MQEEDPLLGRVIAGKLKLLQLLGSGAMGKVYRAHHEALDKTVAIKVLHQKEGAGSQLARRFKAEARAASRLDHPNSLRILDFGEDGPDGLLYIAMEFLDGEDLSNVLRREGRLDSQRTAVIMSQVLAALSVAHQQGVVHRDMKPGNIMLLPRPTEQGVVRDVVKVCDFGLAKVLDAPSEDASGAPLTKQGAILGTPAYMSPEQASGEPTDQATDIYSCGVILYTMINGRPPFAAESATGLLMKHILEEPVPLANLAPDVDPRIAQISHRAMAKKKEHRFASARDMLNALREVVQDGPEIDLPPLARLSSSVRGATPHPSGEVISASGEKSDPFAKTYVRSDEQVPVTPKVATPMPRPMSQPLSRAPSATPSVAPAPASRSTLIVAIVGSVALFLAGVAAALLIPRGNDDPGVSTVAIEVPKEAPKEIPKPTTPEPALAMVDEKKAEPDMMPEPVDPMKEQASASKQRPRKEKRPETKTQPVEETKPPPVEETKPPPVEETKPAPVEETKPLPVEETKPPPVEETKPVEEKKPPVELPQKPKEDPPRAVDAAIASLEIIAGGISRTRTMDALEKQLPSAKKCLETYLIPAGVKRNGEIKVTGRIDAYGKFSDIRASGENEKIESCVASNLQPARIKGSDTGDARISLTIKFRVY